ncbi:hypothetical protein IMAU60204_01618 [Lactobacillus helveticus]|nr:hypothetical protein [Lactobacillus helveticus]
MIGTIVNTLALLVGTSIGCLVKKGINKRYEDVLFITMGLAALGIGWENVTNTMPKEPLSRFIHCQPSSRRRMWDRSGHFWAF